MRIASVKPNDLAVVNDGTLVFVSDVLAEQELLPKGASMIDFITRYDSLKHSLESVIARGKCCCGTLPIYGSDKSNSVTRQ